MNDKTCEDCRFFKYEKEYICLALPPAPVYIGRSGLEYDSDYLVFVRTEVGKYDDICSLFKDKVKK